jgi:hypothetical protein
LGPGIVDQDVDRSEGAFAERDHAGALGGLGHVGRLSPRGIRARQSLTNSAPHRVPLHHEARQLALQGRERDGLWPDRRIDDPNCLICEIAAWENQKNAAGAHIK